MAAGGHQVAAGVGWYQWTQVECPPRLARCRNVIVLAFHGHESRRSDRPEVQLLTAGPKYALPGRALLVDVAKDVEKDFSRQVHQRRIKIEERESQGIVAIVLERLSEELATLAQVTGEVGLQAQELDRARVDETAASPTWGRHPSNDVALVPREGSRHDQASDARGILRRVYRSCHEHKSTRRGLLTLRREVRCSKESW
jgi:hypothetical protein